MAITASDILFKLSIDTSPGNSAAQADPDDSLGGYMSTTEITDATLHNLFDVVTGDENAANDVEYRCFFIHNNHASLTWENVKVWISAETASGADADIAIDSIGVVNEDSATAQAERIANEGTAPGGTFSSPTSKSTGLTVGDIPPGDCVAIWVRRTATNSAAVDNDGVTIRAEGDTAA